MEIINSVDQQRLPSQIEAFIAAHAHDLAHNGSVVVSWRVRGGQKLGPYHRLTCRTAGRRQLSVYVPLERVEQVRKLLAQIQAPHRHKLRLAKARGQLRAATAQAKREVDKHLVPLGLYRKGSEIRGWSTSDLGKQDPSKTNIGPTENLREG